MNNETARLRHGYDIEGAYIGSHVGTQAQFSSWLPEGGSEGSDPAKTRDNMIMVALARIDNEHARFLRDLTGGATVEERDTWKTKEEAARAMITGNATSGQTAMITFEAEGDGTDPAALAQIILAKAEAYQTLIGMAAGLKVKAKAAIAQATAPEVPLDQVEAALTQVFDQIAAESTASIEQWQAQGAS